MLKGLKDHNLYIIGGLMLVAIVAACVFSAKPSSAVSALSFKPDNIISDSVFTNYRSMTVSNIQSFLNSKVPDCDTNGTEPATEKGRPDLTHAQYASSQGWQAPPYTCLKVYTQGGKTAAQIIYNTAQKYKINPQVLIVLLQKEQGLVTDTWPLNVQYKSATGYGCPDTAPCDSQYYGLTNQLNWAGKMFRAILNQSPTWYTPYTKGNNRIYYNPNKSCGSSIVNIKNWSTAALYNYTPYQPNKATLQAGWGTAPCGAYGNRNFFLYFSSWFGNPLATGHSRFITCSDQKYMVERGVHMKRLLSDEAITAWEFTDKDFVDSDPGCSYQTYDATLTNLARSRTTGKTYLVDKGNAYYVGSQSTASAWGLGNLSANTYPQLDADTINENLKTAQSLPRIATSDNLTRGDYYLIDGGTRHLIAGTETGDNSAMRIIRGDKQVPAVRTSVALLQKLTSSSAVDHSFKIGSTWYLFDYNKTRKIAASDVSIWGDFLTGPSFDSSVLDMFSQNTTIGVGFERPPYYYRILDNKNVERTTSKAVGRNWVSTSSPLITQILTNKLLADLTLTNTVTTANGNVRLITCGGNKYLVERNIRTKRAITANGLAAWGFTNKYFLVNDPGCNYPTYAMTADQLIRSRNTGKVYYVDEQKAYYVQSRAAAEAWGFGNTANQTYPQFAGASMHDNLQIVSQLPPAP